MTDYNHLKIEQPVPVKIDRIIDEAKDIRTFFFRHEIDAAPGQFVMLWIPRINMKPFGVSYHDKDCFGVTVCKVGAFTEELFKKKVGDIVGVQGPYGTGFVRGRKKAALVAGGCGAAPLAFLAEKLAQERCETHFIIGAKNAEQLLYQKRFMDSKISMHYCTDDGSACHKGFTTDLLREHLENSSRYDMIYAIGPEIMMKKVIEISDEFDIDCQISLERYMKCGFGVCGQCCVDSSGVCVCRSGPVFFKKYVKENITEFGRYHRDGTGAKQ